MSDEENTSWSCQRKCLRMIKYAFFSGCSVPVILRQAGPLEADDSVPVSFVVVSFVYGKMDGELFTDPEMSRKIEGNTVRFRIS